MQKQKLQEKLNKQTKYSKYYLLIIEKAKLENRKKLNKTHKDYVYYENHHILPKSMFPKYQDLRINKWNSVLLTYREHILIHYLICKHYKKLNLKYEYSKMAYALQGMLGRNKKKSKYFKSRFYENIKVDLVYLDEYTKKVKQTKLERYGDENYTNVKKNKQTKLERYGDENYNNRQQWFETMSEIKENGLTKFQECGLLTTKFWKINLIKK